MNGSMRWLRGRLAGSISLVRPLQPGDSCDYDFDRSISKVGKHAAGDNTENHLELKQLAGGRQSTAVFEAADLAVASIAEQKSQIPLAQTCPSSQQPNVGSFSVSLRCHAFRQPSLFLPILVRRHFAQQND